MASNRRGTTLRIGLIGAGHVVRQAHIPGFLAIEGVSLAGVCSRRRVSASRLAQEFGIARVYPGWEALIEDDHIDAVVVATWPDQHAPVTLAALDAGKHVLIQTPMAMNAREAQRILEKHQEHPRLVGMVAPGPYGLAGDSAVRAILDAGRLGDLREVHVTGFSGELADRGRPLGWRQITRVSGFNMLDLGFLHEAVQRWTPPVTRVFAHAVRHITSRPLPGSTRRVKVGTPDSVQVLATYDGTTIGTYRVSGVARHAEERSALLVGVEGTLRYDFATDAIEFGGRDEPRLRALEISEASREPHAAEREFVGAIRGERTVERNDLEAGARVMHFTEAVARSSRHQEPVELPLVEFSNPSL
jgi:predicted dehydrogenase